MPGRLAGLSRRTQPPARPASRGHPTCHRCTRGWRRSAARWVPSPRTPGCASVPSLETRELAILSPVRKNTNAVRTPTWQRSADGPFDSAAEWMTQRRAVSAQRRGSGYKNGYINWSSPWVVRPRGNSRTSQFAEKGGPCEPRPRTHFLTLPSRNEGARGSSPRVGFVDVKHYVALASNRVCQRATPPPARARSRAGRGRDGRHPG